MPNHPPIWTRNRSASSGNTNRSRLHISHQQKANRDPEEHERGTRHFGVKKSVPGIQQLWQRHRNSVSTKFTKGITENKTELWNHSTDFAVHAADRNFFVIFACYFATRPLASGRAPFGGVTGITAPVRFTAS